MGHQTNSLTLSGVQTRPRHRRLKIALALLWVLLVLYPRPWDLALTIQRSLFPPIDPAAAAPIAVKLDDDPKHIDEAVRQRIIAYAYDWTVYDEPWYFATVEEALRDGRGDCESQAIVLASVLHAKQIPYKLQVSFDHIWVEYAQKDPNAMEKDAVAVVEHVDGKLRVKAPDEFDWKKFIKNHREAHWDPMPLGRKLLLLGGLGMIIFLDFSRLLSTRSAVRRRPAPTPSVEH